MKKIKIKFTDQFGSKWEKLIIQILEDKYKIEFSEKPDFVFAGPFGYNFLKYDCIRIFVTGENVCPDLNLFDYAIGFTNTDNDRCIHIPFYVCYQEEYKLSKKNRDNVSIPPKFCNFVYSNYNGSERNLFFDELSKYQKVDSGGTVKNNLGYKVENKLSFLRDYRFTIAFENEKYPGYVTEKLVEAFAANSIPIYYGADRKSLEEFNEKAYIYIDSEKDFSKAIKKIKEINENPKLLKKYLNANVYVKEKKYEQKLAIFLYNIIDKNRKQRSQSKIVKFYESNMKIFGKIMTVERKINNYKIVQKIKLKRRKQKWQ